ncbi:polyphosphate kinase 2 family protein [bacterium]|nr:polyphosphate kinase 2 family protein [bacterium]
MLEEDILAQFHAEPGKRFKLKDHDPAWLPKFAQNFTEEQQKEASTRILAESVKELADAQETLYASDTYSVLAVFQAMDAAGKDGTIKHVMSGVNPQGCQVYSFKAPSPEELDHTYLWRCMKVLPERGRIGIFNRSYYEEVLVVRVHPELIGKQRIPGVETTKKLWKQRYKEINQFEKHLARNGTVIMKFFLNVSKNEQKKRFLSRLEEKKKTWKFSPADVAERKHWDEYMLAYQEAIEATSTSSAPWYIIPADHKWVTRILVAEILSRTITSLKLPLPVPNEKELEAIKQARIDLETEKEEG